MAFCINCGQELADGAKFCANCGKSVNNNSMPYRKIVYDKEVHKCSNCGGILNTFVTICPFCGYELCSVKTNSPINELAEKIERASSVDEKIELITNFYVPNTREDIYDFFILAVSNLEDNVYDTDDAWQAKLEQTYHKAKLSFGKTPEFEYMEKIYNRTHAKISKRGFSTFIRKNKIACIMLLSVVVGVLMVIIGIIIMGFISKEENDWAPFAGYALFALGICVPILVLEEVMKKEKAMNKRKGSQRKDNTTVRTIGKDANEFIHEPYEDVAEQLRELGFKNIVVKAEKKRLFNIEGVVKGISIAGNSEFSDADEFDVNSKIIIRYYSKKMLKNESYATHSYSKKKEYFIN